MWTTSLSNPEMPYLQWGAVIGASLVAACTDLHNRKIPNRLTASVLLAGLVWAGWIGGWKGIAESVLACALLALPFVLLFLFAGGGAGDAKLMGALGAWLGVSNGVFVLVSVVVAGALMGLGYALARKQFRAVWKRMGCMASALFIHIAARGRLIGAPRFLPQGEEMIAFPYGVAIFAGVVFASLEACLWRG